MRTRRVLKTMAKEEIKKNLVLVLGTTFLYTVIIGVLGRVNAASIMGINFAAATADILVIAMMGPFIVGINKFALNVSRKNNPQFKDLFFGFNCLFKSIVMYLIITIVVAIGFIAFIIPGVIIALMLSMAPYLLADNPEIGIIEALKSSCEIMKGKKFDLFALNISFFLWMLLGIFTFGLAFIWVTPYQQVTEANFYNEIVQDGAICS